MCSFQNTIRDLELYFNTKTLQVQAKASSEVKNKLHDIFNSRNRPVQDNGREGDEGGSEENVDFLNSDERNFTLSEMSNTFSVVSPDEQEDSLPRTHTEVLPVSCVCKVEIAKLWNAIDKLNSQLLPQEKQELNQYRVKCVLYEDKIKKLEEEKANLLEGLRILSTESNFHSQVAPERVNDFHLSTKKTIASNQGADEGQLAPSKTKETMASNQPKRAVHGQQAKHSLSISSFGTASRRKQNVASVPETTPVEHVADQSVDAERKPITVICGDSIVKNVRGWELSGAANKVVVKSSSGATTSDMEDYLKPIIRKEPENVILHVGTNDLKSAQSPQQVAETA